MRKSKTTTSLCAALLVALGVLSLTFAYMSQHLFGFEPCTMCIEIRFWISMATIAGILSLVAAQISTGVASLFLLAAIGLMGAGAAEAVRLVLIEKGILFAGCTPFTFYQESLPLHDWWPSMFSVQGLCGDPAMLLSWLTYSEASAAYLVIGTLLMAVLGMRALFSSKG